MTTIDAAHRPTADSLADTVAAPPGQPEPAPAGPTVRELIAELARVEDAVRALPTYVLADDGSQLLNPELLSILDREREIVTTLRRLGPVPEPDW